MGAEQPETDGFLTFVERKIAALQALADSYKAAQAVGAFGQPGEDAGPMLQGSYSHSMSVGGPVASYDLPTGVFQTKTMPAAIKLFFATTKRKQTPSEVAVALKNGGFESTSKNFEKTVTTTMHRMKSQGELLQFKDGWGLASLYPESLRMRVTKDTKEAKDAKPVKSGKKVRRSPQRKGTVKNASTTAAAGPKAVPAA